LALAVRLGRPRVLAFRMETVAVNHPVNADVITLARIIVLVAGFGNLAVYGDTR